MLWKDSKFDEKCKNGKSILEHIILNIGDTDGDMIVSSKIIGSSSLLF